jgi:hypothetical protein
MRAASFIIVVLIPSLVSAQPATRPTTQRRQEEIYRWAVQLDAPDAAARDRATERLIAIGPRVIPVLKRLLERPPSPEFATRAAHVIDEIPRQWRHLSPLGGDVEGGFQATLSKTPGGKPGELTLEIKNVGGAKRKLTDVRALDVVLDEREPAKSRYADGCVVIKRLTREEVVQREPKALEWERAPRRVLECVAGSGVEYGINLADAMKLPEGEYEVRVVYYATTANLIEDAEADLMSNAVKVEVRGQ